MARPPGPRLPAVAQAALVTAEPYRWMAQRQRQYGDVFSSRFPMFGEVTYVAHPDGVRTVFGASPDTHRAGEANASVLGPVLGANSLLTLDGDEHLRQRKLLLPPFHGERISGYADLITDITDITEAQVATWQLGVPFVTRPAMQRITLEVILRAVFGVRGDERLERFRAALPRLGEVSGLILFFPWAGATWVRGARGPSSWPPATLWTS